MVDEVAFQMITNEDSWDVFDDAARKRLGMSGEEVVRRWDTGEFAKHDSVALMQVMMLRPSGR